LSDADQHHFAVTTLGGRGAHQWLGDRLFVVVFGEVSNGDTLIFGPTVDGGPYASPICPNAADEGILNPR
jgi:hypothetical protein